MFHLHDFSVYTLYIYTPVAKLITFSSKNANLYIKVREISLIMRGAWI